MHRGESSGAAEAISRARREAGRGGRDRGGGDRSGPGEFRQGRKVGVSGVLGAGDRLLIDGHHFRERIRRRGGVRTAIVEAPRQCRHVRNRQRNVAVRRDCDRRRVGVGCPQRVVELIVHRQGDRLKRRRSAI